MIESIKVTNTTSNEAVDMGRDSSFLYLIDDNGLDWGEVKADHNQYQGRGMVGKIITYTAIDTRNPSITGKLWSGITGNEEEYADLTQAELDKIRLAKMSQLKEVLSRIINPLDVIRLGVGEYFLDGQPNSSVSFSKEWRENNEVYCGFTFSLTCANPMFRQQAKVNVNLSGVTPTFHFPLAIPKNRGVTMGIKVPYRLIVIYNTSDVQVGGVIKIKAKGTVTNLTVTNVYTNEHITINKTLQAGEEIEIDTEEKTIYGWVNGIKQQYYKYWGIDNTWLQFKIGGSVIGFSADNGTYKSAEVTISLNQSYYNIGGQ